MVQSLRPPDVEAALTSLLPEAHTKVPNPRPLGFTKVSRAGGGRRNVKQTDVRVLVECYGADELAALDRARDAYARIVATEATTVGDIWVSTVELTEPVANYDREAKHDRSQFVAQFRTTLQEVTL